MNSDQPLKTPLRDVSNIPLWFALVPIFVLIAMLSANVALYGAESSYGPNQIAMIMAAVMAGVFGCLLKVPVSQMLNGIKKSIASTLVAVIILLLIGSLAGTWMMSGIVPAMIYYGLDILNPTYFLLATAVVCAIVSVVTGSSWSTVATVGVALLGIGDALGISQAYAAGAIISGAYFGDKISPLSDTTNLAAAMAGTDLITHIKYMLWTTIPSFTIALGMYLAIGMMFEPETSAVSTEALKQAIAAEFYLSPVLFVVPVLVLVMVMMKIDAVVAIFVGAAAGGLLAIACQPKLVTTVAGLDKVQVKVVADDGTETTVLKDPVYIKRAYVAFVNAMALSTKGISSDRTDEWTAQAEDLKSQLQIKRFAVAVQTNSGLTMEEFKTKKIKVEKSFPETEKPLEVLKGQLAAAKLLEGKGMEGMLNTIWLVITAMCFGGVMEACGLLQRLSSSLVQLARSTGSLIATTAASCLFFNVTASDQYLAIVVPGRMFRKTFRERGLAPQNLSRTLEDAGTVTSVLIPWNTCGAAQNAVLGVSVLAFAPFCFFNIISPIMTILFGFLGIRIAKLDPDSIDESDEADEG